MTDRSSTAALQLLDSPESALRSHLAAFEQLETFAEVASWDQRAQELAAASRAFLEQLTRHTHTVDEAEASSKAQHRTQSLLRRLFTGHPLKKTIAADRARIARARQALPELADGLEAAADKTPNDKGEQKEMLADLKAMKQELTLAKREHAAMMREIRADARRQTANVGAGLGILLSSPKSRRYERMSIRLSKESTLRPHESARDQLERQILAIDRTIRWVQRFR